MCFFPLCVFFNSQEAVFGNCTCFPGAPASSDTNNNSQSSIFPLMPRTPSLPGTSGNITTSQRKIGLDLESFKKLSPQKKKLMLKKFSIARQTFYNEATIGKCDRNCKNFIYFVIACLGSVMISFVGSTPHKIMVLR